jgi:hypothetical protein
MLDHLYLFFYSVAMMMFSRIFPEDETTETKKCMYCLKRIKISHDKCPHCKSIDFTFDVD